jgi:hypothetical protein
MGFFLYIVSMIVLYFVIKLAVKSAIEDSRDYIKFAVLDSLKEHEARKAYNEEQ